jgi:succinoglycan biosynthesis protein ExoL
MKIIFVANNWADAHQQTRLHALLELNFPIICLAVFRDYYPFHALIAPIRIGTMSHATYPKRIGVYLRLFSQIFRRTENDDCIYVYGFDLMMVTFISRIVFQRKFKIVYEVPDIRELFFSPSLAGKLIRWIEKIIIPRVDLLILTSPEFVSEYFIRFRKICVPEYLIIENKIHYKKIRHSGTHSDQTVLANKQKVRIGYFGVLRCAATLDCLIELAEKDQFEIILRGIFMPATRHYESLISNLNSIQYLGPYKVPEDLSCIYSSVDVILANYPFSNKEIGNHLFARTNRFYESLFFKRPCIVQKGTADASTAKLLGNIAIEVDLKNISQTLKELSSKLNPDHLKSLQDLLCRIPESHYQITTEYKDLAKCLQRNNW